MKRFDYQMTNEQIIAVMDWPTLKERQPSPGDLCEYWLLSEEWSSHGSGVWKEAYALVSFEGQNEPTRLTPIMSGGVATCGFYEDEKGVMISDPAITYWRRINPIDTSSK
jgi:hypothetical protein